MLFSDTSISKKIVDQTKKITGAFVNAIKAAVGKGDLSAEDKEILNSMNEGKDEDGGLTVPKDIRTAVKELRRSEDALENLVNVELSILHSMYLCLLYFCIKKGLR